MVIVAVVYYHFRSLASPTKKNLLARKAKQHRLDGAGVVGVVRS